LEKVPSFRCTCYRTGEDVHKFGSMDVARHVGGLINVSAMQVQGVP
jgi:adenylyl- and sulfurtransferase ThiI